MKKPDNNSNNNRASSTPILLNVVHGLLCTNPRVTDVLSFALFTAATLMPSTNDEKKVDFNNEMEYSNMHWSKQQQDHDGELRDGHKDKLRFFSWSSIG